jgi:lactate permease
VDVLLSIAPIVAMIAVMTKPRGWPAHVALPATALVIYAIETIHFEADPNLVNATVVNGLLNAWIPISITAGAIFLFGTMEASGGMRVIRAWLNTVSDDPVAQLMIIGWAFAFMIEGASGFGTPAALAAPILVGLGFPPLSVAMLCLVMNSVPVSFGAVGTPLWFGLGQLDLQEGELLAIGRGAVLIHCAAALPTVLIALRLVLPWSAIRRGLPFVALSTGACVLPYAALATLTYEFPALLGGMVGLLVTVGLAKAGVGLGPRRRTDGAPDPPRPGELLRATFPLWGTVLILLVTRIPQLGVKALLTSATPLLELDLGSLADLRVSRSLALTVEGVFGADTSFTFQTLYVPALLPFVAVALLTFTLEGMNGVALRAIAAETYRRMITAAVALFGALVMVQLLMVGGDRSMVMIIGEFSASATGPRWPLLAAFLGALGSFFSGSATISNLTFGAIQESIAGRLGLDPTGVLSLQLVGAAMGNMVCLNNIVAVCSILGVTKQEGAILRKTVIPMVVYGGIAAGVSLLW